MDPIPPTLKWYQTGWGIVLVGLGALFIVGLAVVGIMTFNFYRVLKSGKGLELTERFKVSALSGSFTTAQPKSGSTDSSVVDRDRLEKGDFPALGADKPAVTIVQFVDFKCPNCKVALPITRQILARYSNKVKLINRNSPFESLHPGATQLATIAWCAKAQDRYWPIHDYFFSDQETLPAYFGNTDLQNLVNRFGLDQKTFTSCLADQRTLIAINKDYSDALELGVRGTPTFFINGVKVEGVVPIDSWESLLKDL